MGVSASRRWPAGFLPVLGWLALGCSAGEASANPQVAPRFDLPCPDGPCGWQVSTAPYVEAWEARGSVQRVPTWHERDYGVELRGAPVELSQLVPDVSGAPCFEFKWLADFDDDAEVYLLADFDDDGGIEFERKMPDADWHPLSFLIRAPLQYTGVRFIIRKTAGGRVVLSRLYGAPGEGCDGLLPPLSSTGAAAGSGGGGAR